MRSGEPANEPPAGRHCRSASCPRRPGPPRGRRGRPRRRPWRTSPEARRTLGDLVPADPGHVADHHKRAADETHRACTRRAGTHRSASKRSAARRGSHRRRPRPRGRRCVARRARRPRSRAPRCARRHAAVGEVEARSWIASTIASSARCFGARYPGVVALSAFCCSTASRSSRPVSSTTRSWSGNEARAHQLGDGLEWSASDSRRTARARRSPHWPWSLALRDVPSATGSDVARGRVRAS